MEQFGDYFRLTLDIYREKIDRTEQYAFRKVKK